MHAPAPLRLIAGLVFGASLVLPAAAAPAAGQEPAGQGPGFHPRLKWLYASAGLGFDYWGGAGGGGNGFPWKPKDRAYNPPQTTSSAGLGGTLAFTPRTGLWLSVPAYYNRIEAYTDRYGTRQPSLSAAGIGDIEIGVPVRVAKATVQPQAALPGVYGPDGFHPFYHPRFQRAWNGLGVFRAGLGASLPWKAHYFWAAGEWVFLKPGGSTTPLVEAGDYVFKGGYSYKYPAARLQWKAGADATYNGMSWAGSARQNNFSLEPRVTLAWLPPAPRSGGGRELALSAGGTLYSWQGGERVFHSYGSRRLFLGLYYGLYF